MKILILTPQLPYPPHQGTSLRNWHIIRGLAQRHEIDLLSFLEQGQTTDPAGIGPLLDCVRHLETVPVPQRSTAQRLWRMLVDPRPDMAHRLQSPLFDVALRQMLVAHQYDVVQVEGIELATAIPIVRGLRPGSKILFDDHNAEAELQYRAFLADLPRPGRWPAAAYSLVQTYRLRKYEAWACREADWVTVVSDADKQHLQSLISDLQPTVIPNCIDVTEYRQPVTADTPRYDVVITGKMDYRPNVDAVLWFGREIWPHIRNARPGTTWAIVGQKPHARLDWLREEEGVTVTGRVPQIQPYLTGAAVVVMPFRVGSGTRLKLIEAMAAGKALVSTRLGAEGFPVSHSEQLLLADKPKAFADAVVGLLTRPGERQRLGANAQQFAARYDWRRVIPRFEAVYAKVGQDGQD